MLIIEIAVGLANNCYRAYMKAPYELKTLMARAFFQSVIIENKKIVQATLNQPLDYICAKRLRNNLVFQLANVCGPTGSCTRDASMPLTYFTAKL